MNKAKIAVVGCGLVSKRRHIPAYKRLSRKVELIAVCDLNAKLAHEVANEMQVPHYYANVKEMLGKHQLDIIDICVPPEAHASVALEAIGHGCHVIMEKPMALTVEDCDRMISKAKGQGLKLCTIHSDLFHPSMIRAKRAITSGEIGEILGMDILLSTPEKEMMALSDHWCHRMPGGVLGETGPHVSYMVLDILGNVERVDVKAKRIKGRDWAPYDAFLLNFLAEKGMCNANLVYSSNYWAAQVRIIGTEGCLGVDLERMTTTRQEVADLSATALAKSSVLGIMTSSAQLGVDGFSVASGRFINGTERIIREFIQAVSDGERVPVSENEGRATVELMERVVACYERKYRFREDK